MDEPIRVEPNGGPDPGTPRWVWVFSFTLLVLVAAFIILHLVGRGLGGHAG